MFLCSQMVCLTFQPQLNRRLFKLEIPTWPKIPGHYRTLRNLKLTDAQGVHYYKFIVIFAC